MWHASVANGPKDQCQAGALEALAKVGDSSRGEWHEWTGKAYHLRRRLSEMEERMTGPVRDIRETAEAVARVKRLPALAQAWARHIGEVR